MPVSKKRRTYIIRSFFYALKYVLKHFII